MIIWWLEHNYYSITVPDYELLDSLNSAHKIAFICEKSIANRLFNTLCMQNSFVIFLKEKLHPCPTRPRTNGAGIPVISKTEIYGREHIDNDRNPSKQYLKNDKHIKQ